MQQYLDLCNRTINEGQLVQNERTGKKCLTVINASLQYDVGNGVFPLLTTRKSYYKSAIAELLGYLRGYSNAADFRKLGTNTWNANANENKDWLNNPNRTGEDDMGRVYGVQGRYWRTIRYKTVDGAFGQETQEQVIVVDQLRKLVGNLSAGIDDRGEILTFWNPGEFDLGCLRPCMHTHTFSLLDGVLHLTSYQRSCDIALGLSFNTVQCYVLLALMAQITGHRPGNVYHHIVNAHIYEDQLELMKEQIMRVPFEPPTLKINPVIKTFEDIETWVTTDDFELTGYEHHDPIAYPFSV